MATGSTPRSASRAAKWKPKLFGRLANGAWVWEGRGGRGCGGRCGGMGWSDVPVSLQVHVRSVGSTSSMPLSVCPTLINLRSLQHDETFLRMAGQLDLVATTGARFKRFGQHGRADKGPSELDGRPKRPIRTRDRLMWLLDDALLLAQLSCISAQPRRKRYAGCSKFPSWSQEGASFFGCPYCFLGCFHERPNGHHFLGDRFV